MKKPYFLLINLLDVFIDKKINNKWEDGLETLKYLTEENSKSNRELKT